MATADKLSKSATDVIILPAGAKLAPEQSRVLIDAAKAARDAAYAPYSGFKVGSAVLLENGEIFRGCNVENASYGATVCAERVAVFNAVQSGHTGITAVAVVADYPKPVPPCGMCRQVIAEFNRNAVIVMANTAGEVAVEMLGRLLPASFDLPDSQT